MKAKLINGNIQYFIQPPYILGDATQYATEQGYKDLIYQEGNGGTYETATNIVVETPAPVIGEPMPDPIGELQATMASLIQVLNDKGIAP